METPNPQTLPGRFPSLDGWRAVCILMVLGVHDGRKPDFPEAAKPWTSWIFDGDLAVRFFFVISGFLITYLLLREYAQTGAISLKRFYFRRALRILPIYFAFLAVCAVLLKFIPARQPLILWIGNLTFTTNLVEHSYTSPFWTMSQLWTLAIEEQFYLLWPIMLCVVGLRSTRRILLLLLAPVLLSPLGKAIIYIRVLPPALDRVFQYHNSIFYFDTLAIGCIAAVFFVRYHTLALRLLARFPILNIICGAALIIVPRILAKYFHNGELVEQTGSSVCQFAVMITRNTSQAVGFAILLLQSVSFPRFFAPLNWGPVRTIGILSYSLYIWHTLFFTEPGEFGLSHAWFMTWRGCWAPAFALAAISFYCLEKPFLSLRSRLRANLGPANSTPSSHLLSKS